jgi:hypothetical protein
MQEGITASPTWIHTAAQWVVSFVVSGGILKLINLWQNRHKPRAEVHLTEESAAEIRVRASSSAGDAIMRFMDRLDTAQITIDRLRGERDSERLRADQADADAKAAQMFVEQLNRAAKLKGVNLSDFLPDELNPPKE